MHKNISILGSTGSIGIQTLDVARNLKLTVSALTANKNIDLLEKQAREFNPRIVAIADESLEMEMKNRLKDLDIQVCSGVEGLKMAAAVEQADIVIVAVVGIAGLIPTWEAISRGKDIALANKEVLVTAGSLVMSEARKQGVNILPVDSEHSAIFQCIMGNRVKDVSKIILTASGGPFRGKKQNELKKVTLQQALKHPNWDMGRKITIDSATLMNKGLEVIEARWLFDIEADNINVVIHPQSIIHSMVEYNDGSIISQMGMPDMRIPIQFALTFPERKENNFSKLDLYLYNELTFERPDYKTFPCLNLAYESLKKGGSMPVVLNAVNEVAVNLFIQEKIGFMDIPRLIENVMGRHTVNINPSLDDIIEVDKWARQAAVQNLKIH